MVEDYLSDREQEEALRTWWRDNWRWILGGIALGVALLVGWFKWQDYREDRGEAAATQYDALRVAAEQRNLENAQKELDKLVADHGHSSYTQQGRLLVAKLQVDGGKIDAAVPLLREVIDKSKDDALSSIAKLRLGRVLVQQAKHDEAIALLDVDELGAFAAAAREIRGDANVAKGDQSAARAEYAAALAVPDAKIDRALVELKLQEVGGTSAGAQEQAAAAPKEQP